MPDQSDEPSMLGGCWVAYYKDRSSAVIFPREIEALRYAVERSTMLVKRVEWGVDLWHDA